MRKEGPIDQLSIYLPGVMLAYAAFCLGLASPGPNILAVMGVSMSVDRSSGAALATGVAVGSLSWALLTVFGLSALLSAYASALLLIKIFGGLYLLWLAYKCFRSAARREEIGVDAGAELGKSWRAYFWQGYAIQMTNPKAALTWIAIMSLGVQQDAPFWVAAVLVAGTFILSLTIHILYAVAFSTPAMARLYRRARRGVQATLGLFFAAAGIKLLSGRA